MPTSPISLPSMISEIFPEDIPRETALTNAIRYFPNNDDCKKAARDFPLLIEGNILKASSSFDISIDSGVMKDALGLEKVPGASDTAIAVVALLSEYGGRGENLKKYLPRQSILESKKITTYNKFFENIATGREKNVNWISQDRENRYDKLKEVAASIDSSDSMYFDDSPDRIRKTLVTPDDRANFRIKKKVAEIPTKTSVTDNIPNELRFTLSNEENQKNRDTVDQWKALHPQEYLEFDDGKENWEKAQQYAVSSAHTSDHLTSPPESDPDVAMEGVEGSAEQARPSRRTRTDAPLSSASDVEMGGTEQQLRRSARITERTNAAIAATFQSLRSPSRENESRQGNSR